jgi:hypothetical protein
MFLHIYSGILIWKVEIKNTIFVSKLEIVVEIRIQYAKNANFGELFAKCLTKIANN